MIINAQKEGKSREPVLIDLYIFATSLTQCSGGGLDNRFGGDDTKVTGHTQTTNTHNGQFTQTSSHLGDDGKVHFSVQSGKF